MKEDIKFTPGPWVIGKDIHGRTVIKSLSTGDTVCVAKGGEADAFVEEVRRFNLALMASAPDLLEALEQLFFASENADETGYVTDEGFLDLEAIQDKARAAIAKAKGKL